MVHDVEKADELRSSFTKGTKRSRPPKPAKHADPDFDQLEIFD